MNEQKIKNYTINESGSIVVHNYCAAELPQITVTIRSGQTTYRFSGSYDGTRSFPVNYSTTWQRRWTKNDKGDKLAGV